MSGTTVTIRSPWDGRVVGVVSQASGSDVEEALYGADTSFAATRALTSGQRSEILRKVADNIERETEELARCITLEAGKAIPDSKVEVQRAVQTFRIAAEEAKRIGGEILPLDTTPGNDRRAALIRRFPIGPILGITPFNFPLNLVAHKVAPAVACGNPIIIKPAPQTPISALRLGAMVVEAGWPDGAISVLPARNDLATAMLRDPRIRMLSFTGSAEVGWQLKAAVPKKKVTLELGGDAAVIVHADADLDFAAERIVRGGFVYSGQSCISVQRVFVHGTVRDALVAKLKSGIAKLCRGEPFDGSTQLGPMINEQAAIRAESWINDAKNAGAQVQCGGARAGNFLAPALLTDVPANTKLASEEVFAPVVWVNSYSTFEEAVSLVNGSRYGLQTGVFTHDWNLIATAWRDLEVGAVLINESPTWRADQAPYGGVKDSGCGREGIRSAIESITEERLLIIEL